MQNQAHAELGPATRHVLSGPRSKPGAMNIRSRSVRRELLLRMMFAGLAGTLVVGSAP